jgi:hypothetical protein
MWVIGKREGILVPYPQRLNVRRSDRRLGRYPSIMGEGTLPKGSFARNENGPT